MKKQAKSLVTIHPEQENVDQESAEDSLETCDYYIKMD